MSKNSDISFSGEFEIDDNLSPDYDELFKDNPRKTTESEDLFNIIKMDSKLPVYLVKPKTKLRKKDVIEKIATLRKGCVNEFKIIRLDSSLVPQFLDNKEIVFEETDCILSNSTNAPIVNINDSSELNVGIRYRQPHYCNDEAQTSVPLELVYAVDDATYEVFCKDTHDQEEVKHQLLSYDKLSPAQKQFFITQYNRPEQKVTKQETGYTPIKNIGSLKLLFEKCRKTYSPDVRAKLDLLFGELDDCIRDADKRDIINQISHILGIDTQLYEHKTKTYEQIMECFDKHVYGMTELKQRIAEYIIAMQYSGSANFEILLVGPPGVGKTSIGEVIAECYDNPFVSIDCAGADFISMGGLVKSYGGAKAGKCLEGMWAKGRSDVVMMLDEIDKLAVGKDGNPYSIFLKALGPQKVLYDEYVDHNIDVSATKFIATANDIDAIPEYIVNRFGDNVFYINAYSKDEKIAIAERHIIRKLLAKHKVGEDELSFTKEALEVIAKDYCEDEGAREMTSYIQSVIRKVIVLWTRGMAEKPFVVDGDFVRANLRKIDKSSKIGKIGFSA